MARRVELGIGVKFIFHDRKWKIIDILEGSQFVVKDLSVSGVQKTFTEMELLTFHESGALVIEEFGKNTAEIKEEDELVGFNRSLIPDFSMLDEDDKEDAKSRFEAIKPLLQIEGEALHPYIKTRAEELKKKEQKVSERSLYRWLKCYLNSQGDIRSLVSSYDNSGPKQKRMNKETDEIIKKYVNAYYNQLEVTSVKQVARLIRHEINDLNKYRKDEQKIPIPSIQTIRRRIKEQDPYEMTKKRFGVKAARDKYGAVEIQEKPTRPLERVECDHTPIDVIVVHDETREVLGRPWLTYIIDCYSSIILGFYIGFEHPSYISVMQALKHAISPKGYVKEKYPIVKGEYPTYGLPKLFVTDNGKEFLSKDMEDACLQLGIELYQCPIKSPWYKGAVERSFRTANQGLFHSMKGTTFSNVGQKKKREYNSEKKATIGFNALVGMVHKWIIDIHSEEYSTGVKGVPKHLWKRGIELYGRPEIPASKFDWEVALMKVDKRKIQNDGLQFQHLKYQSNELQELRLELEKLGIGRVKFKYDPSDLSKIYVWDDSNKKFIEALCTNQKYSKNLSLYVHRLGIKKLNDEKKQVDEDAIAEATSELFEWMKEESKTSKKVRKQKARAEGMNSAEEIKRVEMPPKKTAQNESAKKAKTENQKNVLILPKIKKWGGSVAR